MFLATLQLRLRQKANAPDSVDRKSGKQTGLLLPRAAVRQVIDRARSHGRKLTALVHKAPLERPLSGSAADTSAFLMPPVTRSRF